MEGNEIPVVADNPSAMHPSELVGAGFRIRAVARAIDLVVHYAVWMLASTMVGVGVGVYSIAAGIPLQPLMKEYTAPTWYSFLAAGIGYVLYHTVMEGMNGATLGKRARGLSIVDSSGGRVSFRKACGRNLAMYIDSLFFGLVAYGVMGPPLQQRLGDKWCDTVVVKRSKMDVLVAPKWGFGAALVAGLFADAACYLIAVGFKLSQ